MKVLILGIYGMLGHKLVQVLAREHEILGTCREVREINMISKDRIMKDVMVNDFQSIITAIDSVKPDVVINCIGLIKQLKEADELTTSLEINSLFPQKLALACNARGIRLIHFSTDCVFSGTQGMYKETDIPDATDAYGQSKFLGEVKGENCLTIRSSIIGRELGTQNGLLEWFIGNRGKTVHGYRKAIYSGFTTLEMGNIVNKIIVDYPALSGVWQIASQPISKYELLKLINTEFKLDINIKPDDSIICDRSLDGSKFSSETGYKPPSWQSMIEAISKDDKTYTDVKI
ncbi:MAG: SDR family oxidoreductase [Euryarchaeota archaeon]|nr:SDR family oxidoreductase [Euryarchaeota archaeon]MBU4038109.1 SDR family oxidoreductase [Pseudomonadota bacterium]